MDDECAVAGSDGVSENGPHVQPRGHTPQCRLLSKPSAPPVASSDGYLEWRAKNDLRDVCGVKTEALAEQIMAQVVFLQVNSWNETVHLRDEKLFAVLGWPGV